MTNLVLIVHCTSTLAKTIKYNFSDDLDLYVIYNLVVLNDYISKLLTGHKDGEIKVVLVYYDLPDYLDAIRLLLKNSSDEQVKKHHNIYVELYKQQLTLLAGSTLPRGSASTKYNVTLPQGQSDKTIGFRTFMVFNVSHLQPLDYILEGNCGIQQLLRFLALKHGAYFAAISGQLEEVEDPEKALLMLSTLQGELKKSNDEELQIFKSEGSPITDMLQLHQCLMLGWDLWSRIQLVAKLIPRTDESPLLENDVETEELNDLYDEFLESSDERFVEKAKQLVGYEEEPQKPEPPKPLSYKEIVAKIENAFKQ